MSGLEIETTQNVSIEYEMANIGDRVLAQLIDLLIMFGYFVFMIFLIGLLVDLLQNTGAFYGVAFYILLFLPFFFYDLWSELFMGGQTLGKKILKIKVIKIDGTQPCFTSYFLRWLIKPIDVYMTYGSVGMITILINGKGQRLGDLAGKTTVIKLKPPVNLEDTIYQKTIETYKPVFSEVKLLSDSDIAIVKEVLDTNMKIVKDRYKFEGVLDKTKKVIERKMGIQSNEQPVNFLTRVLYDYNHLMSN